MVADYRVHGQPPVSPVLLVDLFVCSPDLGLFGVDRLRSSSAPHAGDARCSLLVIIVGPFLHLRGGVGRRKQSLDFEVALDRRPLGDCLALPCTEPDVSIRPKKSAGMWYARQACAPRASLISVLAPWRSSSAVTRTKPLAAA